MSVQFGIWKFEGQPADEVRLRAADSMLAPYAPDGHSQHCEPGITLIYRPLHVTAESRREKQPHLCHSGDVLLWDGRLDNRDDLVRDLGNAVHCDSTDAEIVGAGLEKWGLGCFPKLLGDWALTLWNPRDRTLALARDIIGLRPLYYWIGSSEIWWSSVLDPLVLLSRKQFELNRDYVAGWLGMYPAADSTPYLGIHAVPPASFLRLQKDRHTIERYWDFNPNKKIRYTSDAEYEDHFRTVFRQAVRRRLRTDRPICAELSGGMDSPSIVCMADLIAGSTSSCIPQIHTLSFYDESEPNANERPYFTTVEELRGRTGCHIDMTGREMFNFVQTGVFEAIPSQVCPRPTEANHREETFFLSNDIRVVLSGIGGDEVMGGVPTPIPELQDLMIQRDFRGLVHKLKVWALYKRKPWLHLLGEALHDFLPRVLMSKPKHMRPAPWLSPEFTRRHSSVLDGVDPRIALFGPPPSFQACLGTLEVLRRQMATKCLPKQPAHEKRYPFLDRTLLEFVFAIPREQLLRPGYRRSLMRRALGGIVPAPILERRRKAYASRGPRAAISSEWSRVSELSENMISRSLGIIDERSFRQALAEIINNDNIPIVWLMRTIILEVWLRNQYRHGVLMEVGTHLPILSPIPVLTER